MGDNMILFASDLDNTLIYSYKKAGYGSICVETKEGKELSFMTPSAYSALQHLVDMVLFVPVTTRSVEQYKRIKLLNSGYPEYALASNGGILLVKNNIDKKWQKESLQMIEDSMIELTRGINILKNDPDVLIEVKLIDGIFVYTKTKNVINSILKLKEQLDLSKVTISNNGEKIYIIPNCINKGSAIKRLGNVVDITYIICAGDSLLDAPMLQIADISVVPDIKIMQGTINNSTNFIISQNLGMAFSETVLDTVNKCLNTRTFIQAAIK